MKTTNKQFDKNKLVQIYRNSTLTKEINILYLIFCRACCAVCTYGHIEANPLLKENHTRGAVLRQFPLTYEAFDNKVASGKCYLIE